MYDFALNRIKLQLAIASAKSSSTEDVKTRYVELGGLLAPEPEVAHETLNVEPAPSEETSEPISVDPEPWNVNL